MLEKVRSDHDMENQNLEANLDVVLDRLRQAPTHEVRRVEDPLYCFVQCKHIMLC